MGAFYIIGPPALFFAVLYGPRGVRADDTGETTSSTFLVENF